MRVFAPRGLLRWPEPCKPSLDVLYCILTQHTGYRPYQLELFLQVSLAEGCSVLFVDLRLHVARYRFMTTALTRPVGEPVPGFGAFGRRGKRARQNGATTPT